MPAALLLRRRARGLPPRRRGCRARRGPRRGDGDLGLADPRGDLREEVGVLLEEEPGLVAPLADLRVAEGEPGAGALDDAGREAEVDDVPLARDPLVEEDVELG